MMTDVLDFSMIMFIYVVSFYVFDVFMDSFSMICY